MVGAKGRAGWIGLRDHTSLGPPIFRREDQRTDHGYETELVRHPGREPGRLDHGSHVSEYVRRATINSRPRADRGRYL